MIHCTQQGFCKIRATEYRLKDICNSNRLLYLGRINEKVTAKQTRGILIPVLRKAPNVIRNTKMTLTNYIYILTIFLLPSCDTISDREYLRQGDEIGMKGNYKAAI